MHPEIRRQRLEWEGRILAPGLFLTPLGVLVFSALLRTTSPAARLVVWALASIAVNVATGLVARHATWPIPEVFDAVSFSVWCS